MRVPQVPAGGPGLMPHFIKLRVPPVPRLWGPGRGSRTAGSVSTRAVANLSRGLSIQIRSLRFLVYPFDHGDSLTTASPLAVANRANQRASNGSPAFQPRHNSTHKTEEINPRGEAALQPRPHAGPPGKTADLRLDSPKALKVRSHRKSANATAFTRIDQIPGLWDR